MTKIFNPFRVCLAWILYGITAILGLVGLLFAKLAADFADLAKMVDPYFGRSA